MAPAALPAGSPEPYHSSDTRAKSARRRGTSPVRPQPCLR